MQNYLTWRRHDKKIYHNNNRNIISAICVFVLGLVMLLCQNNEVASKVITKKAAAHHTEINNVSVSEIDTDKWADAIFKAEGGYKATYLYGIRSIPYNTESQARKYCKNTVYNTLVKYRSSRCKKSESNIDCLARRYCPQGSDTDNGTCQYWKKNVGFFLRKGK